MVGRIVMGDARKVHGKGLKNGCLELVVTPLKIVLSEKSKDKGGAMKKLIMLIVVLGGVLTAGAEGF